MVEINKNCQLVVVVLFQVLLSSVQVTQSIVDMETRPQDEDHHCHCSLKNVSLSMVNNRLQFVTEIVDSNSHYSSYFLMANVSRCYGGCAATTQKSSLVCRPTLTTLKTVAMSVPWQSSNTDIRPLSLALAVEEHKSCLCVDPNSINITLKVDARLRGELQQREEERLSREIRSVAPTISNDIITTYPTSAVRKGEVTNREIGPDGVKPTEHEIVYYKTCLACREQQELCRVNGQIYDSEVCHCVYPASRTFLNSFYTLGVVMLTVMVCCFLVFGVQKGDDNVLNSSRRSSTRRQSSCSRRCSHVQGNARGVSRQSSRRFSSRDRGDIERNGRLDSIISVSAAERGAPGASSGGSAAVATTAVVAVNGVNNDHQNNGGPDAILVNNATESS